MIPVIAMLGGKAREVHFDGGHLGRGLAPVEFQIDANREWSSREIRRHLMDKGFAGSDAQVLAIERTLNEDWQKNSGRA